MPGAYGSDGGIAQYNRDLISAMAASSLIEEIVVLARKADRKDFRQMPPMVVQLSPPGTQAAFAIEAVRAASQRPGYDIVFCGHIHLLVLATLAAAVARAKLWLQAHGLEAWKRPSSFARHAASRCDLVTAVSRFTRMEMIRHWWEAAPTKIRVLPNTVSEKFTPGPRSTELIERYDLRDRCVILTVSRLTSADNYKGHDRIITVLPRIMECVPNVTYLVVGDGDGREHLQKLAAQAGLQQHVIFAGHVDDHELIDHYRTSDVFVMPSTREGFGIVFLQAAACGLPTVGGCIDGSWDGLREGRIGAAVDPGDDSQIVRAVVAALTASQHSSERAYATFRFQNFQRHVAALLNSIAPAPHKCFWGRNQH
ncbi:MAG: glycosyltransferase family 4 protein [Pseudomonadota bacterium]